MDQRGTSQLPRRYPSPYS